MALYAVLDGSKVITLRHLLAALAVWDYCNASARYIFGDAVGDDVADKLLDALRQAPEGLHRTEITNVLHNHVSSSRIEHALTQLERMGKVQSEQIKTRGRPSQLWRAT